MPDTDNVSPPVSELSYFDLSKLTRLAIFKHGFTFHTADALLSASFGRYFKTEYLHGMLIAWREKGFLRQAQDTYHFPKTLRDRLQQKLNEQLPKETRFLKLAELYYHAGCALAPLVNGDDTPSLAMDRAFSPENLFEAEQYFEQSVRICRKARNTSQKKYLGRIEKVNSECQFAFNQLRRFELDPNWNLVKNIIKASRNINASISRYYDSVKQHKEKMC